MTEFASRREISFTLNGQGVSTVVDAPETLAETIRERLGMTGTKVSCELQVCGACTVLVDGQPVSSCSYFSCDVTGREVVTVEGLAEGENLSPLQEKFIELFALQCGFCTPGFLMMGESLLRGDDELTPSSVAEYLEGNICRCTGYAPIIKAVLAAAAEGDARD